MKNILMIILAATLGCGSVLGLEIRQAEALKIDQPPNLDGKLDEPFWQKTSTLDKFYIFKGNGKRDSSTEIRVAYDNTWFYFGIKCANPRMNLLSEKIKKHDDSIPSDESIELFLDPGTKGKLYYHFSLSAFNVKGEQRVMNGVRERANWNFPWFSATNLIKEGWTGEIAIPLYLVLSYGSLDEIRINISRNLRDPFMDTQGVVTHDTMIRSSWNPVVRGFHDTGSFGKVVALKPGKVEIPFLAILEEVKINPYYTKEKKNYFSVEVAVRGSNHKSGQLEIVVNDKPITGKGNIIRKKFKQEGTKLTKLKIPVPVSTIAGRNIAVTLQNPANGNLFSKFVFETPPELKVMSSYLNRNYYTEEKEAVAVCNTGLPKEMQDKMEIHIRNADGEIIARNDQVLSLNMIHFPLDSFNIGKNEVSVELRQGGSSGLLGFGRKDGELFYAQTLELIKRKPKPGCEWKIDKIERVVLNNGKPFFPFGPVMGGISYDDEKAFKYLAENGFNTFFQWRSHLKPEDAEKFQKVAEKYGLYVINRFESYCGGFRDFPGQKKYEKLITGKDKESLYLRSRMSYESLTGIKVKLVVNPIFAKMTPTQRTEIFEEFYNLNLPRMVKSIDAVKNFKNLVAYNSFDEPCGLPFFDQPRFIRDIYFKCKEIDGYHPVMLLYSSHIPHGDEFVEFTDILCTDPYWVPAAKTRNSPNFVSYITWKTDERAKKFRQPIWIMPVGEYWSGMVRCKRAISAREQYCQSFLAVIHGAKGLFWFRYPFYTSGTMEAMKNTASMLEVIGPMAVAPSLKQEVTYQQASLPEKKYCTVNWDPLKKEYPDVQGKVFRDPGTGGLVLVAANSQYYPVEATFSLSGLSETVKRTFAEKSLTVKDNTFSERLSPYAVRAYRLGKNIEEPIKITISSLRPEKLPPPERAYPNNVRVGKKNLFTNPSFETETLRGWPDYYFGPIAVFPGGKFGKKCVRIVREGCGLSWQSAPQVEKKTPFVWSMWLKGEKGGEKAWIRHGMGAHAKTNTFNLTNEWQRYSMPVTIKPRLALRDANAFWNVRVVGKDNVIYIDGIQLEKGYKNTPFED